MCEAVSRLRTDFIWWISESFRQLLHIWMVDLFFLIPSQACAFCVLLLMSCQQRWMSLIVALHSWVIVPCPDLAGTVLRFHKAWQDKCYSWEQKFALLWLWNRKKKQIVNLGLQFIYKNNRNIMCNVHKQKDNQEKNIFCHGPEGPQTVWW